MFLGRVCHAGTPWRYNMQKTRLQSMKYEAIGSKKVLQSPCKWRRLGSHH